MRRTGHEAEGGADPTCSQYVVSMSSSSSLTNVDLPLPAAPLSSSTCFLDFSSRNLFKTICCRDIAASPLGISARIGFSVPSIGMYTSERS